MRMYAYIAIYIDIYEGYVEKLGPKKLKKNNVDKVGL